MKKMMKQLQAAGGRRTEKVEDRQEAMLAAEMWSSNPNQRWSRQVELGQAKVQVDDLQMQPARCDLMLTNFFQCRSSDENVKSW